MNTKEFNSILKIKMLIVYKYLIKNGCSHNDAEDIVQDTFIKAIQYIDGINLNKLTPSHKNLLLLKYEMDLTYKDIGEILDISENTVKTYLYRARNNFKKFWEKI